nr:unnamed protein product [Callosobruchus chinensis]
MSSEKSSSQSQCQWSNERVLEFLELYQAEPHLWNPMIKKHKNRNAAADIMYLENRCYKKIFNINYLFGYVDIGIDIFNVGFISFLGTFLEQEVAIQVKKLQNVNIKNADYFYLTNILYGTLELVEILVQVSGKRRTGTHHFSIVNAADAVKIYNTGK